MATMMYWLVCVYLWAGDRCRWNCVYLMYAEYVAFFSKEDTYNLPNTFFSKHRSLQRISYKLNLLKVSLLLCRLYSPRSTIFPNRFFPRKKFFVVQFHLRFLNWYWHSCIAWLAPFAMAWSTPGFSLTNFCCFFLKVLWIDVPYMGMPGAKGDKLFGSPAFAMPLLTNAKKKNIINKHVSLFHTGQEDAISCFDKVYFNTQAGDDIYTRTRWFYWVM